MRAQGVYVSKKDDGSSGMECALIFDGETGFTLERLGGTVKSLKITRDDEGDTAGIGAGVGEDAAAAALANRTAAAAAAAGVVAAATAAVVGRVVGAGERGRVAAVAGRAAGTGLAGGADVAAWRKPQARAHLTLLLL